MCCLQIHTAHMGPEAPKASCPCGITEIVKRLRGPGAGAGVGGGCTAVSSSCNLGGLLARASGKMQSLQSVQVLQLLYWQTDHASHCTFA